MKTGKRSVLLSSLLIAQVIGFCDVLAVSGQWCGSPISPPPTPKPTPPPPPCQPNDKCKECSASPCYVASGHYVRSEQDLAVKTNGFPLLAERNYRSTHAIDGPTGFGWLSSVISRLYYGVFLYSA